MQIYLSGAAIGWIFQHRIAARNGGYFPGAGGTLTAERGGELTQVCCGGGCRIGACWPLGWRPGAIRSASGRRAEGRCQRLVGVGDRPRGGGDDGGRGPCREHGGDLVVTALEIRMAACPLDY